MSIRINHEAEVEIDGADVAICLGHDMDGLIAFINEIDIEFCRIRDDSFPKAVYEWAVEVMAERE